MIKAKAQVQLNKVTGVEGMTGVIVSAETLMEHLFLNMEGERVALNLRKDFLWSANTPELRTIIEGRVAEAYAEWKVSGKHGYSAQEVEEMEKIRPETGGNIQEAILGVLRKLNPMKEK